MPPASGVMIARRADGGSGDSHQPARAPAACASLWGPAVTVKTNAAAWSCVSCSDVGSLVGRRWVRHGRERVLDDLVDVQQPVETRLPRTCGGSGATTRYSTTQQDFADSPSLDIPGNGKVPHAKTGNSVLEELSLIVVRLTIRIGGFTDEADPPRCAAQPPGRVAHRSARASRR